MFQIKSTYPGVIAALILLNSVACEMFINPIDIRTAILKEDKLVKIFKSLPVRKGTPAEHHIQAYITDQQQIQDDLSAPLDTFSVDDFDDEVLHKIVGNAIHVFKFMRRATQLFEVIVKLVEAEETATDGKFWSGLEWLPRGEATANFTMFAKTMKATGVWPEEKDLEGATLALCRIQATYSLPTMHLANGIIWDVRTSAILSIQDLVYIGRNRVESDMGMWEGHGSEYALGIEWMETAYELSKAELGLDHKTTVKIKELLTLFREWHDQTFQSTEEDDQSYFPNEEYFIRPIGLDLKLTGRQLREEEEEFFQKMRNEEERRLTEMPDENFATRDFYDLCRGSSQKLYRRPLSCYLSNKDDPYLNLMPLKVEPILSEGHFKIEIYHDILTESEVTLLKSRGTKQKLRRGSASNCTLDESDCPVQFSAYRTQSLTWLPDGNGSSRQLLNRISRRLDHVTGLSVSKQNATSPDWVEAESLQVGVYSSGGFYAPHLDAFPARQSFYTTDSKWRGNRIATAMIYLNDDMIGGATVFPKVGAGTFPSQGSIVFWYNLYHSGSINPWSLHGGCPTIYGIKWVANKWIREGSQVFKKPCEITAPPSHVLGYEEKKENGPLRKVSYSEKMTNIGSGSKKTSKKHIGTFHFDL